MNTRKIQEVGNGTFTVSLPREWANEASVSRGDTVEIYTNANGILSIQPQDCTADPTGSITLKLEDASVERIRQTFRAAYTAGYTEVTLTTEDAFADTKRRTATDVANMLAGAAMTTVTQQELTLRVPLDTDELSIRRLVRRLSSIAVSMHERAISVINDDQTNPDLSGWEDQADRLFAMIERSFVRAQSRLDELDSLGLTRPALFELWSVARELERVADHAERIGRIAREFEQPTEDDHIAALQRVAADARVVVDRAVEGAVDTNDTHAIHEALGLRGRVRKKAAAVDRRLFGDTEADYRLARILDSVRRTAEHGGNIGERGLQRAIRRGNADKIDQCDTEFTDAVRLEPQPRDK